MIKFCVEQWDKNKDKLREVLENDEHLREYDYKDLFRLVVEHIFNTNSEHKFDKDSIVEINDSEYQGTLLFLVHKRYQPNCYDYLMTYVYYGSCSMCDTISDLTETLIYEGKSNAIPGYMKLCLDMVCRTIRPYKDEYDFYGENADFEEVVWEEEE